MSEFPKPASSAGSSLAALEEAAVRHPNDPALQLELGKHYLANGEAVEVQAEAQQANNREVPPRNDEGKDESKE